MLMALLGLVLLTGCTRRYILTLTNGTQITARGKPKLQGGNYVFEDATGEQSYVSSARVREIAPASMAGRSSDSGYEIKTTK